MTKKMMNVTSQMKIAKLVPMYSSWRKLEQNSWTARWGERGLFRIAMSLDEEADPCECDICNMGLGGMFMGNHSDLR